MIRDVLMRVDLDVLWRVGMVIMLVCFVLIVAWALTRTSGQVGQWSRLPMGADTDSDREHTP